jgi:cholesterol oxidase
MKNYDYLVIGSGFGGSVSACRLAQKNYSVAIIEKGRDYRNDNSFPKSNWDVFNYLWAPVFRCFGIQSISVLKNLLVLHGVGVGGGSLVYANTLLRPHEKIFKGSSWPTGVDWDSELDSHYDMAKKMLGVVENPIMETGEKIIEDLSKELNCHDTFERTNVGVYFNDNPGKEVEDPFFKGDGPKRTGCTGCGSCMIGCPEGAKNSLDKNYLHFALKWGSDLFSETTVDKIEPFEDGYLVHCYKTTSIFKKKVIFKAKKVVLSAGVMGTVDILYRNKTIHNTLKNISPMLGETVRTNGESLLGVTKHDKTNDLSNGIAIGAQFRPDKDTKIEGVRYPKGSDFMKLLTTPLTPGANRGIRPFLMIKTLLLRFVPFMKIIFSKDWASNTVILLVMQSIETKMSLKFGRTIFKGFKKGLVGDMGDEKMKTYIPVAQDSARIISEKIKGEPLNCSLEVGLGSVATAHILGGAILSNNSNEGVIGLDHEVHGYEGLYVCDASVIPANLAVNPSLTISALAERFCSLIPVKNGQEKQLNFS